MGCTYAQVNKTNRSSVVFVGRPIHSNSLQLEYLRTAERGRISNHMIGYNYDNRKFSNLTPMWEPRSNEKTGWTWNN